MGLRRDPQTKWSLQKLGVYFGDFIMSIAQGRRTSALRRSAET